MTNNTPDYEDNLYFDSQDTKNEQQKDLCITSEQLTEQWKTGELPCGWYYIKIADIVFIDFFEGKVWKNKKDEYIDEVLAKVPSYEEWKQLKEYERIVTSYNMKPIDYDIACETVNKLLDDNKRLKHDVGNLGYKIKNQRHEIDNRLKEIEKLKELLKECLAHLTIGKYGTSVTPINILCDEVEEALK